MRRKSFLLSLILVAVLFVPAAFAGTLDVQQQRNHAGQEENKPKTVTTRHIRRHRRRSIKHTYGDAGKSAGRGGKRFGRHVAHGKPIKGGKELGKGVGGMGKGVGQGTGRVGKKVGKTIKKAVTP
jgi:hypothetical protein